MTERPKEAVPSELEATDQDGFPADIPEIPYGEETPAGGEPVGDDK